MTKTDDTALSLVREVFDITEPPNDAAKFTALGSALSEIGWWNRAERLLNAATPDGTQGDRHE